MEYRTLGGSYLKVSVLGLGCWPLGGGPGWGDTDEREAIATIHAALDHGVNLLDTAEAYNDGNSEVVVGKALAGRRAQAFVATKVGPRNTDPATLRAHCEASLRRLGTDYVDLYQVHWPMPDERVPEAMATLDALKAEGKLRAIGLSNHGAQQIERVVWTGSAIAGNQLCYNLLTRAIEFEVLSACRKHGIGVIAYMPLMQGLLTGTYTSPDEVPEFRSRTRHFGAQRGARHGEAGHETLTFTAIAELRAFSESVGQPMAQLALGWVMANPSVTSVLVGGRRPDQLLRNLAAVDAPLSADVIAELGRITLPLREAMGPNIDLWQGGPNARSF